MRVDFLNDKPIDKDGNWSPAWRVMLQTMFKQLNNVVGQQGIQTPQLAPTVIAQLTNVNNSGGIVYDMTNHAFKGNVNGAIKTFTVS